MSQIYNSYAILKTFPVGKVRHKQARVLACVDVFMCLCLCVCMCVRAIKSLDICTELPMFTFYAFFFTHNHVRLYANLYQCLYDCRLNMCAYLRVFYSEHTHTKLCIDAQTHS